MIETLEEIDRSIVLAVNSWNSPFWDSLMWLVSGKLFWFPFYFFLLVLFFRKEGFKKSILFLVGIVLAIAIADLSSVHLFKEVFMRYRPSHNTLIQDLLHFHQFEDGNFYQGGMYGFVSSHAANFSAICTFAYLTLRRYYSKLVYLLVFVLILICYSRLYLGVHYLSDVIAGSILGAVAGYISYQFIFLPLSHRIKNT